MRLSNTNVLHGSEWLHYECIRGKLKILQNGMVSLNVAVMQPFDPLGKDFVFCNF